MSRDPLLASNTDDIGTKHRVAIDTGIHDTVGIDLVPMSVNSLLVQGVQPFGVALIADMAKGIARGGLCPHRRPAGHPPQEISIPQAVQSASSSARCPSRRLTSAPERHLSRPACERLFRASYVSPCAEWQCRPRNDPLPLARRCQWRSTRGTRAARQGHGARHGRWLVDDVKRTGGRCRWLMGAGEMVRTFRCEIGVVLVVTKDEADASVQGTRECKAGRSFHHR
ncbi:hypothetical protein EDB85DRAFT_450778 [Lactarius pseudohatsudake]|nr:hypothetical protein EDB85DRAFT_450778 [Lactarius pseudohatsudake]